MDDNIIITIDGVSFDVNLLELVEISEFADKFAERTEDWNLERELAGIFFNYELTLGENQDPAQAQALYDKIHEPAPFHEVTMPHGQGTLSFTAYITGTKRSLKKRRGGTNIWGGYKIKFISKAPQVTG